MISTASSINFLPISFFSSSFFYSSFFSSSGWVGYYSSSAAIMLPAPWLNDIICNVFLSLARLYSRSPIWISSYFDSSSSSLTSSSSSGVYGSAIRLSIFFMIELKTETFMFCMMRSYICSMSSRLSISFIFSAFSYYIFSIYSLISISLALSSLIYSWSLIFSCSNASSPMLKAMFLCCPFSSMLLRTDIAFISSSWNLFGCTWISSCSNSISVPDPMAPIWKQCLPCLKSMLEKATPCEMLFKRKMSRLLMLSRRKEMVSPSLNSSANLVFFTQPIGLVADSTIEPSLWYSYDFSESRSSIDMII